MRTRLFLKKTVRHRSVLCFLPFCFLWVIFSTSVVALDRDQTLTQLHHTAWRSRDGAPGQISALAQTNDGYLWIGSAVGLFRFDGLGFERYEPPPGVTLPSYNIYTLMPTPDGGLWISFRPSGLGLQKDGSLTVFINRDEIPDGDVFCFGRDLEGRIWAGTNKGLVLRDGSRWIPVDHEWNLASAVIRTLFVDRDGTLWVATNKGIFFLLRGSRAFRSAGMSAHSAPRMAQSKDGRIWIADNDLGIRTVPVGKRSKAGGPEIPIASAELQFDREGSLWFTDFDRGLRRIRFPERVGNRKLETDSPQLELFSPKDGLSGDVAYNLLEDREGNIWVSTANGLDRFRDNRFVPVILPNEHRRLTLLPVDGGGVCIGSAISNPLLEIRGERQIFKKVVPQASTVYRAPNGDVWWGSHDGLWRQRRDRFDHFPQPKGTVPDFVWEILSSGNDSGLWVYLGDLGLIHFKNGVWTNQPQPSGLPDHEGPSASHTDSAQRVWLGYNKNRVYLESI